MKLEKGISIRMEAEEEGPEITNPIGFYREKSVPRETDPKANVPTGLLGSLSKAIEEISKERERILSDTKLSANKKLKMLESNRKTLVILSGGKIKKTDNIIYSILIFSGFMILSLALLNVHAGLPIEVTLTFVGTVIGGTIATIAQKIGKIE